MTREAIFALFAAIGIPTVLQVSPLRINPWSWLGALLKLAWRAFCRSLNAEVLKEIGTLQSGLDATRKKLDAHVDLDDEREANRIRERILLFSDELGLNVMHSEEMFNDILRCIDWYEEYCKTHESYQNSRAVAAINHIKDNYAERLVRKDFLQGGRVNV